MNLPVSEFFSEGRLVRRHQDDVFLVGYPLPYRCRFSAHDFPDQRVSFQRKSDCIYQLQVCGQNASSMNVRAMFSLANSLKPFPADSRFCLTFTSHSSKNARSRRADETINE